MPLRSTTEGQRLGERAVSDLQNKKAPHRKSGMGLFVHSEKFLFAFALFC